MLQGLEVLGKVALDAADADPEFVDEGFDGFYGKEEVLAESWQHTRHYFERGKMATDKAILMLPVRPAEGGKTTPESKKKIITLGKLLLVLLFKCSKSFPI